MGRGSFFKALGMVILSPSILKGINWHGEQKCMFDEKRINDRLGHLRQYPLEQKDCYPPKWAESYQVGKTFSFKTRWIVNRNYAHGK